MRSRFVTAASGLLIAIATVVAEISYVIEPFESIDNEWFDRLYNNGGHLNLNTTTDDALFGERALLVEYEVQQTETWGGFVDFGWIQNRTAHNCRGATHMSLWYKLKEPQSRTGRVHVRLIMLDDSDCGEGCADPPGQSLENYYSFHYVLDGDDDFDPEDPDTAEWKELRVELRGDDNGESPFWRTGWTGQRGNNVLDPDRLRGWRIELSMDSQAGLNATSAGVVVFDQLACVGGGEMLGAAFNYGENRTASFADAVSEGAWFERYYESPLSRNLSEALLEDGMLRLNYTIEQTEEWGGFLDYQHLVPGAAYYNLSDAFAVWLRYDVTRAASVSGRAHLRMILMDGSDCEGNCSEYPGQNLENYYSFNYILDDDATDARSGYVTVALEGDSDSESPFWRPGWTGVLGNNVLDTSNIKGFRLELSVDSQGEVGSLVSGAVSLSQLSAVLEVSDDANSSSAEALTCVNEPTLHFREISSAFQRIEFLGSKCCATCEARDDCLYALSNGIDCFLASHLDVGSVGIQSTEHMQKTFNAYWMDDSSKRGDFCEKCECRDTDRTIDCRGRDLAIIPKTFSPRHAGLTKASPPWTPRTLDLRDNPRLMVLGSGALASIADSLEELRLPLNMRHLAFESVNKKQLPSLDVVRFEGDDEHDDAALNKDGVLGTASDPSTSQVKAWTSKVENVITESSGFFGEVCCGRGAHVDLSIPAEGLRFCDMKVDTPGADAVYEEFLQYVDASPIEVLRPSSSFMAEAAESPKKCAEYCAISSKCRYFSYDARWKESEHTCYLFENNGTVSEEICCSPDDFADIEGTEPGWTSGRPPQTRNEVDKARVISGPRDLVVNKANGYEAHFVLSLGSTPLRGAVWIEPTLAESTTALDVVISPRRVALYDATMTATIHVAVSNVEALSTGETLVVTNVVQSCDTAYTTDATPAATAASTVYIDVVVPNDSSSSHTTLLVAILVPLLVVVAIVAYVYVERKKRQADSVWRVKPAELNFGDPLEIIGRGTFGLVLLAEYRGTQVAVKRVIPPKLEKRHTSYFKTKLFGRGDSSWRSKASTAAREAQTEPEQLDPTVSTRELDLEKGTKTMTSVSGINSGFGINSSGMYKTFKGWRSSEGKRSRLKADFIVEMRHLSKLRHPCITTVMGAVIERKEEPMLVMEYMDHGSLYDLLHNETMMLEGELLLPILRDIAQGVRFLHAASPQVIHGDLKAQNVLVDSKFRAKVADFGLSQKKQVGATGTPFWMAPELLRGDCDNTAASDVYSFGIILYEVYSRRDPYEGENYEEVMKLVCDPMVNKRPPVPSSCPPQVQPLMTDCLVGDPDKRPTFEELDQRLKRLDAETVEPGEMHFSMQSRKEKDAQRTTQLLFEVFPRHIAEGLRDGRKIEPESRDLVTIFFSDIVGFTNISSTLPPIKISDMLDRLYNSFDALSREHDVFKVETIGDAYMAVTNLVKDQPDHAKRIADFSVHALRAANETLIDVDDPDRGCVNIRVGFHSGPVVANVVGSRNPRYCLFGDTVNTASRMESNSEQNRIHCSERAAKLLRRQHPEMCIRSRGKIDVKGKGMMHTYWVNEEPCSWPDVEIREGSKVDFVPMKKQRRSSMLSRSSSIRSRSSDGSISAAIFKAGIFEGIEGNHV